MRTKSSVKNISASVLMSMITIIIGLVAQRIFIHSLGTEYLGINGLFANIVSMLGLVELGLGSAIYYHLYKPLAAHDRKRVKSLVLFYRGAYRYIAAAVLLLGLCVVPFLGRLVGQTNISENISIIYLLFLADIVCSYLLVYKRSVLYADQKNFILNLVHIIYFVIMNILQISVLLTTKNYYLYLVIKVSVRLLENIALTLLANRLYPYLKETDASKLNPDTKADVYKKVKGLSFHKIGSYIVLGTDNIIISVFLGITVVGLYSNYYLVIGAIGMIMSQAFTGITASVGNLLVTNNEKKSYAVFRKISFANFWLSCFAAVSLLVIMNSFITVWIGSQFLLGIGVLIALSINLYFSLTRGAIGSFKEAGGIFHEDRYVPIAESIVNIVLAITFVKMFGLAGVFMGTICSTLLLHLYSYPKYVYKPLFKESYRAYYREFVVNFLIVVAIGAVTFGISRALPINGRFMQLVFNIVLCLIVPNLLLIAIFRKSDELSYYRHLVEKTLRGLKKKQA